MELYTSNPDIKYQHCFLRFDVKQSAHLEDVLLIFNEGMRE